MRRRAEDEEDQVGAMSQARNGRGDDGGEDEEGDGQLEAKKAKFEPKDSSLGGDDGNGGAESSNGCSKIAKPEKLELDIDAIPWCQLPCSMLQLRLDIVLKCGQSFRWRNFRGRPNEFIGVLNGKVWILSQDDHHLLYKTLTGDMDSSRSLIPTALEMAEDSAFICDYFQLSVDVEMLYRSWEEVDPLFSQIGNSFFGVRILRQDPVENLFSFICSSNNNIDRISEMVESLCRQYGPKLMSLEDGSGGVVHYYGFPTLEALSVPYVEQTLRSLKFGYRADFIGKAARMLLDLGGRAFLMELRASEYKDARSRLMRIPGVGPKVADCVLLMSLDKTESVPVDTHMFQIAANRYLPHLKKHKSITNKAYDEIGDHFRRMYGKFAGWAHSVLFSSDLGHFQHLQNNEQTQVGSKSD